MYPAGVPGISVRHVSLDDGVLVRVIESGPPTGSAVILVHGWGSSVYSFSENIPALVAAGHRVIAFDLPGHGLSEKPGDESRYTTAALTAAVLAVANAMSVGRFAFVGHSMGGALGLDLATRGERRLERLALINPVGLGSSPVIPPVRLLSPPMINRVMPRLLTRQMIRLVLRLAYGTKERPTEQDIEEYWAPTQFEEFSWACRACLHRVNWRRTPAIKLRSLRLPVLVISGRRDRLVRGTLTRARLIPAARVVPIRDGGHIVMQECAERTNAELTRFLAPNTYRS
jgi:pimeloyl-ACP methyl ester carboxylesterase